MGCIDYKTANGDRSFLTPTPAAWTAPELFEDVGVSILPTPASDVYAFGSVCVEVGTNVPSEVIRCLISISSFLSAVQRHSPISGAF